MSDLQIRRLHETHAAAIVDCFQRVYGGSYANEHFNNTDLLIEAMREGTIRCVGALDGSRVVGHMAMNLSVREANYPELGNTVVDPSTRGGGLAWQVGEALIAWCRELGYTGFLHYPTTDHHIMQQQSIKKGFEVGLMLGYIPTETDGQVAGQAKRARSAATIVFEPIASPQSSAISMLPNKYADTLPLLASRCGIPREWQSPEPTKRAASSTHLSQYSARGLSRLNTTEVGEDFAAHLGSLIDTEASCLQIDLALSDQNIDLGVQQADEAGFLFCGWLPGFRGYDVLRLQRVERSKTDMTPNVVNPDAQALLRLIQKEA